MRLITALLPLCALLLPCALHADTFEGKVSLTVTSSTSKNGPQTLNMSIKGSSMRTDVSTTRGTMSAIVDGKARQMIILMPQQKMYMVQPLPSTPAAAAAQAAAATGTKAPSTFVTIQDTGTKENILGYPCEKYTSTTMNGTSEIWLTDQLGNFAGLFNGGPPGRSEAPQPWEAELKGKNVFPMRVITTMGGKGTFRMDVVAVQKTPLPDSLFMAPDGWRKFDLGALMGGSMGSMPASRIPSGPPPQDN